MHGEIVLEEGVETALCHQAQIQCGRPEPPHVGVLGHHGAQFTQLPAPVSGTATLAAALRLRSSYCSLAHGRILAQQLDEPVLAIVRDRHGAGLSEVDLAVMELAERVVDDAGAIDDAARQPLRDLGLSEPEIGDVVLAAPKAL